MTLTVILRSMGQRTVAMGVRIADQRTTKVNAHVRHELHSCDSAEADLVALRSGLVTRISVHAPDVTGDLVLPKAYRVSAGDHLVLQWRQGLIATRIDGDTEWWQLVPPRLTVVKQVGATRAPRLVESRVPKLVARPSPGAAPVRRLALEGEEL